MSNFKIAVAQVFSIKGDISANIETHIKAMAKAEERDVSVLVFPELSLIGYEPELAHSLAFTSDDSRLMPLIEEADKKGLTIVVGAPLIAESLPKLGAIIVSPRAEISTYSKMHLHPGEEKFFSPGNSHFVFEIGGQKIGIAICADTNEPSHAEACARKGASVYAASVFITEGGYESDTEKLKNYAKTQRMLVAMANHNRPTGDVYPLGKVQSGRHWVG